MSRKGFHIAVIFIQQRYRHLRFGLLQVHFAAGLPQPEQTPFSIGLPHFLQGEQPQDWHIFNLLEFFNYILTAPFTG
jgi:hypothetical protein